MDSPGRARRLIRLHDVTPIHEGTNPIPTRLELQAFGNRGFSPSGWLDNPAAGARTP